MLRDAAALLGECSALCRCGFQGCEDGFAACALQDCSVEAVGNELVGSAHVGYDDGVLQVTASRSVVAKPSECDSRLVMASANGSMPFSGIRRPADATKKAPSGMPSSWR